MVEVSTEATADEQQRIDLTVGGMTCASCAARVEKRLNKLEGAVATVNYATEKARVLVPQSVTVAELVAAVEQAGYTAQPLTPAESDGAARGGEQDLTPAADAADAARAAELDLLRRRTLVSAVLSVPVILL
ncbi:cation transporter, partial [Ruania albidiflava]|uniref:cation transporter n=1 Tax=Ruania albidiflava TaxID=366586 RepID=UPI0023F25BE0